MVIKIPNTFIKTTSLLSLILYILITTTSNPHSVLADEVTDEEDPDSRVLHSWWNSHDTLKCDSFIQN